LAHHPGWIKLTMQIMARYWKDIGWRMKSKRDRCLSLGNALVAMLLRSLMDRGVEVWLKTGARELVVDDGRVTGLVAERDGRTIRIRAKKAVLLGAGGFESNQKMRDAFLPKPTSIEWTSGSPASQGDGIRMGRSIGAALEFMHEAWWSPTTVVPGE